jgi:integrase/recombinase XerD
MKTDIAVKEYLNFHQANSSANTLRNYKKFLALLQPVFNEREIESINSNEIHQFIEQNSNTCKQSTKHLRFTQLKALFNFCINILNIDIKNPCDTLLLNKTYRLSRAASRTIINKEVVDEIIYKTTKTRNRLLLELQARSGLRIGEVLKLCPKNIENRRVTIEAPKSGKEVEFAYLPASIAEKLNRYITQKQIQQDQRIFNLSYAGARHIVRKAGQQLGVVLRPHDLRRYSATYASRSGIPLEVVSKVILRHQDLRTTQLYLGKITEEEALHWVDSLHNR